MVVLPLLLGLTLGIRHAADADHVATIATVVLGRTTLAGALRTAVLWGLGHTSTFFAVGLAVVLFNLKMPASLEVVVDVLIGLSLLLLGANQLWRYRKKQVEPMVLHPARSFALGSMHGLAGSATVALLALSTIASRSEALVYLGLFGVGTVVGMALITLLLAWSFQLSSSLGGAQRALVALAGVASCFCGLLLLSEVAFGA